MTQAERILQYMIDHGSISPIEAENEIGCMRLAARIADLREDGVKIRRDMVSGRKQDGGHYRYARYRLEN